jgi:hypothetical protein
VGIAGRGGETLFTSSWVVQYVPELMWLKAKINVFVKTYLKGLGLRTKCLSE